jgi:hypothetical protein
MSRRMMMTTVKRLPDNLTIGQKYGAAMEIKTEAEAKEYLELCIQHNMRNSSRTRDEADVMERMNIGYYAGYYDTETAQRVMRLFNCVHPFFGRTRPLPEDAFQAGKCYAKRIMRDEDPVR